MNANFMNYRHYKYAILLSFMLISVLSVAQTIKVTDAPSWFFNPPSGEYAGVSLPLENQDIARQQAVIAALLSYVAQNETEVFIISTYNDFIGYDDSKGPYSQTKAAAKYSFKLPGNYRIVQTAINQYGEMFISLQVTQGRSDSIQVVVQEEGLWEVKDGFAKDEEERIVMIAGYAFENSVIEIKGREYTLNSKTDIEVNLQRRTQRSSAEETFVADKKYSYRPTANRLIETDNETYGKRIEHALTVYPVQRSLGIAYMMALLNGIKQEVLSLIIRTQNDIDIGKEISSFVSKCKVTQPAKVLKAGIDTEGNLFFK